jgi:hypothetical protein
MQNKILEELKQLRIVITRLLGTTDLPPGEQFSTEAIKKASQQFRKMSAERDEWVKENDISKYIRNTGWSAGRFIREEFGFNAWIKNGHHYLYNKKALQMLAAELKKRNVNLGRYIEYKRSEAEFQKKLSAKKQLTKGKRPYRLDSEVKGVTTSDIPAPSVDFVRQDLEQLKNEFFEYKMADYVDIYRGNHAMLKFMYHFEKYLEPGLKKRCLRWCENFNYANHALELITKKKEKFIPVKEEDMIQL